MEIPRIRSIRRHHLAVLLLLLALLVQLFSPLSARAITGKDISDVLNGWTYFKDNDKTVAVSPCAAAAKGPEAPVIAGKVFMIGDSIAEGNITLLTTALRSIGFAEVDIDAKASRNLSTGTTDLDGLGVLERDATRYADAKAIVVELGTNGGVTDASIKAAITTINTHNTTSPAIYWVNIGVNNDQRTAKGNPTIDAAALNATITRNASLGYKVIDWATVLAAHPDYVNPADGLGVHPIGAGKQAFADTVAAGVNGSAVTNLDGCVGGGGPLAGADNAQKIYNYLIAHGLTPIQASGFMGNLQAESGFDPHNVQDNANARGIPDGPEIPIDAVDNTGKPFRGNYGYGIAQWTSAGRQQGLVDFAAKAPARSTGDLALQLDYLWQEITTSYKNSVLTPLQATTDLRVATDIVLKHFECPTACVNLAKDPTSPAAQAAYNIVLTGRFNNATGILARFGSGAP